ncbi:MAG: hypothetical protein U0175_32480 [Caldilineaceae bacterium]
MTIHTISQQKYLHKTASSPFTASASLLKSLFRLFYQCLPGIAPASQEELAIQWGRWL